jgi:hypothetical protein
MGPSWIFYFKALKQGSVSKVKYYGCQLDHCSYNYTDTLETCCVIQLMRNSEEILKKKYCTLS